MAGSGKSLAELRSGMRIYPQIMINVRMRKRFDLKKSNKVRSALTAVEAELADKGRVVLRPSGTEPVVRVMVEGSDPAQVARLSQQLADAVQRAADEAA